MVRHFGNVLIDAALKWTKWPKLLLQAVAVIIVEVSLV